MRTRDLVEMLLLAVLWGAAYLFMRAAVPAFGPAAMVDLRLGIAALMLMPVLALRGGLRGLHRQAGPLLVLGTLYTALPFTLLAFAATMLTAGQAAILNATSPLFAAIIAHFSAGERITPTRAIGLVTGFAGVALLVWGKASFAAGGIGMGVLAVLIASSLWGFGATYTRKRFAQTDPVLTATGSLVVASAILAPLAWLAWPPEPPGARAWAEVVFMGVASTGIGFLMYFRLLRNVGPVRAVSVTFLNPLVAMVSAVFYLGEPITGQMLAGCAVILFGTALTLDLIAVRKVTSQSGNMS